MHSGDTIAAISSAGGPTARMIVRVSGPVAWDLAASLCPEVEFAASMAIPAQLRFGEWHIPSTLYVFQSPRSYTGEDLIEFHIPGNPLLARILLERLHTGGARSAEAGEFTARAYFNGKIGLTEAEGVAATIAAHSEAELRAARQLLAGELARRLRPVMELIADTLALVEVGIDFTEEDVTFLAAAEIESRIARAEGMLKQIIDNSAQFERLAHEPRIVLAGRPNAGKSTLLNALAGTQRAVVSSVAGTTRDAISIDVPLRRGIVRLVDVAGISNFKFQISNSEPAVAGIDRQMSERAMREMEAADFVLLVHDASSSLPPTAFPREPDLVVYTKIDLAPATGGIGVCALSGVNMDLLRVALDNLAFGAAPAGMGLALNARHHGAIAEAREALARANHVARAGHELLALELRESLDSLGQVLGSISPDDVLGRIFSGFCIGK